MEKEKITFHFLAVVAELVEDVIQTLISSPERTCYAMVCLGVRSPGQIEDDATASWSFMLSSLEVHECCVHERANG